MALEIYGFFARQAYHIELDGVPFGFSLRRRNKQRNISLARSDEMACEGEWKDHLARFEGAVLVPRCGN